MVACFYNVSNKINPIPPPSPLWLLYRSMFNVVVLFETLWDQTLMVQVAKRGASVLKRRKSRNRMEPPNRDTPNTPQDSTAPPPRSESDGDVVFYTEEPRSGDYYF